MDEQEVAEAIAEQEEHIKRSTSCGGVLGRSHLYHEMRGWDECMRCGVTKTGKDYQIKKESAR